MSSQKRKSPSKRAKNARGARYTSKQKSEVISFVHAYNKKHGRGGQSQAVKKFGVTALTIASWLKGHQIESKAVSGSLKSKIAQLTAVCSRLRKLDKESSKLKEKHDALLASILGELR